MDAKRNDPLPDRDNEIKKDPPFGRSFFIVRIENAYAISTSHQLLSA